MDVEVAVVGNGVAGYTCATRLARAGMNPALIGPGLPVDRPCLSKAALTSGIPRLFADRRTMQAAGIGTIDGLVTHADLDTHSLQVACGSVDRVVRARVIVLATGLSYQPAPIAGLARAYVNATPEGLKSLSPRLATPQRILIVGAGLIGVESSVTLALAGHEVTLIDRYDRPLNRLHEPLSRVAEKSLAEAGVRFLGGVEIAHAALDDPGRAVIETSGHGSLDADLVIAATGTAYLPVPGSPPRSAPFEVDQQMRVPGLDSVYAIGDCAAFAHERFGRLTFPQWDAAVGTAEQAADAILGRATAYRRTPYWWSDLGGLRLMEYGVAAAAVSWRDESGLHVGRDKTDTVVCVLVVGEPRRGREALSLLRAGQPNEKGNRQ